MNDRQRIDWLLKSGWLMLPYGHYPGSPSLPNTYRTAKKRAAIDRAIKRMNPRVSDGCIRNGIAERWTYAEYSSRCLSKKRRAKKC